MKTTTLTILVFSLFLQIFTYQKSEAQSTLEDELAQLNAELDSIFANESDSTSLFALIDQLIKGEPEYSEIQFRIGYSSRVTSAGRDFGLDQQGITPGLAFYHKSGLFTDISGFWNSELDPKYNLTVLSLGYLGRIKRKTSFGFTYDHSFYTENSDSNTLTNALSGSITQDFKILYTGLDYSYSFGSETAHRLVWNLTGNLHTKGFGPFRRITFLPSVAVLFGNQNIIQQYTRTRELDKFQNSTNTQLYNFSQRLQENGFMQADGDFLIRMRNTLNDGEELGPLQQELYNRIFLTRPTEKDNFGLMNYYLTFPILFETNRLNLYFSYNYNIPRNIAGSEYQYESNGYFGFSVAYNLKVFKKP